MFETKATEATTVAKFKRLVDRYMEEGGSAEAFPMAKWVAFTGWTYSRTWQIARRHVLETRFSGLLVDTSALIVSELAKGTVYPQGADATSEALHSVVKQLRGMVLEDGKWIRKGHEWSWGEINVRMGISEGQARKLFRYASVMKDRGLRIGKGGRFAYGDQLLYQDNMKAEGAMIPVVVKGRPKPNQCLNFKPKRAPRARKAAAPKADEA